MVTHSLFILLFCFCFSTVSPTCYKRPDDNKIGNKLDVFYIPFARLGRAINKNKDQLGPVVIPDDIVQQLLVNISADETESKFKIIKTDDDAKTMLDINGKMSLQLQLGVGNVDAQGAASYMRNSGDRSTYAELMVVMNTINRFEILHDEEKYLTKKVCESMKNNGDTHIITGIQYGAQCIVSVRVIVNANEKASDIIGELEAKLEITQVKGDMKGKLTNKVKELNSLRNVTISTYCNAQFDEVPTNMEEALKVAKAAPKLFELTKGVPVKMSLTPLGFYKRCLEIKAYKNAKYLDIYLESSAAMLNDVVTAMKKLQACVDRFELGDKADGLKELVMTAMDQLRKAEYDMRAEMSQVDATAGIKQFKKYEKMYVVDVSKDPWNYRYWTEYVIVLCNRMLSQAEPPKEDIDATMTPTSRIQMCHEANAAKVAKGTIKAKNSADPQEVLSSKKCYKASNPKAFFTVKLDEPKTVYRIELLVKNSGFDITALKSASLFAGVNQTAYDKTDELTLVKRIDTSNTGMTVKKYDGIMTKISIDTAYYPKISVIRLEAGPKGILNFCSFKAMAQQCKWSA